jgi:orotidine-5'-phosphate decarboxylase
VIANDPKIIVALGVADRESALKLAKQLDPKLCRVKVGKESFVAGSPRMIGEIRDLGFEVFLDLKFHDIPNTVAAACKAAVNLGVWMLKDDRVRVVTPQDALQEIYSMINQENKL